MGGREMPWGLKTNGPDQVVDGAPPRGQDGREHQNQKAVRRRRGKRGSKHVEDRHSTRWDVHSRRPSIGCAAAYSMCRQTFHQKRSRFPTPFIGIKVKRAKVELRRTC